MVRQMRRRTCRLNLQNSFLRNFNKMSSLGWTTPCCMQRCLENFSPQCDVYQKYLCSSNSNCIPQNATISQSLFSGAAASSPNTKSDSTREDWMESVRWKFPPMMRSCNIFYVLYNGCKTPFRNFRIGKSAFALYGTCVRMCWKVHKACSCLHQTRRDWMVEHQTKRIWHLQEISRTWGHFCASRCKKLLCVYSEACDTVWSGVVTQVLYKGLLRSHTDQPPDPLAFVSGHFSSSQLGWSTLEKEAFAVMTTKERMHWLLAATDGLDLYTGHHNLFFLFDPLAVVSDLSISSTRKVLRWAVQLSMYIQLHVYAHQGSRQSMGGHHR